LRFYPSVVVITGRRDYTTNSVEQLREIRRSAEHREYGRPHLIDPLFIFQFFVDDLINVVKALVAPGSSFPVWLTIPRILSL